MFRNLKNTLSVAIIAIFATVAQAQIISGTITTPNALAFGAANVTVVGNIRPLGFVPFALPSFGTPVAIQFTGTPIFQFSNLPLHGSGAGSITGLSTLLNFVIDPGSVAIGPLNFATTYNYDSNVVIAGKPYTIVTYTPTGAPTFVFGGSTYRVDLNNSLAGAEGSPTTLATNTITGSITNLTPAAPEPGTLALVGLGIAGLVIRRRKN